MAVVSTGFFDGVHLGHREVIKTLVRKAHELGDESLVLTFWPHPRIVLQNGAAELRLLSTLEEKREMLCSLGVDRVEVIQFSREFASMKARDYLRDIVAGRYGASCIVLGYDNRLGSDMVLPHSLESVASELGLDVEVVPAHGELSSSRIRASLASGRVEEVSEMLGRPYSIEGTVVSGKRLGRTIGFPTANMQMKHPLKAVPGRGVYLTEVEVLGRRHVGMTNVGDIVETHILDFSEDIYGMDISLSFRKYLRDPIVFDSVEGLRRQLEKDKAGIMQYKFDGITLF